MTTLTDNLPNIPTHLPNSISDLAQQSQIRRLNGFLFDIKFAISGLFDFLNTQFQKQDDKSVGFGILFHVYYVR